ncbi:MAG: hypothetical protein ACJ79H_17585 [Myxococcales bacterium]
MSNRRVRRVLTLTDDEARSLLAWYRVVCDLDTQDDHDVLLARKIVETFDLNGLLDPSLLEEP